MSILDEVLGIRVESVVLYHNGYVFKFPDLDDVDEDEVDKLLSDQRRKAEKEIHRRQKEGLNFDGYYIFKDKVYKVFAANTDVKKITGSEAKEIKRRISSS